MNNYEYLILNDTELCWFDKFIDAYLENEDVDVKEVLKNGSLKNYEALTNLHSKHDFELVQVIENSRYTEMLYVLKRINLNDDGEVVCDYATLLKILDITRKSFKSLSKFKLREDV